MTLLKIITKGIIISENWRGGKEAMHSSEKPHWSHSVAAHADHCVRVDTFHMSRRSTKPLLGDKELYKELHFSENSSAKVMERKNTIPFPEVRTEQICYNPLQPNKDR